eukprot:6202756-Pleurochrysis_carterae.AAC.1
MRGGHLPCAEGLEVPLAYASAARKCGKLSRVKQRYTSVAKEEAEQWKSLRARNHAKSANG